MNEARKGRPGNATMLGHLTELMFVEIIREYKGTSENGRWLLAPRDEVRQVTRWYHPGTLILETPFTTGEGTVSVVGFLPVRSGLPDLVRTVIGRRGRVRMTLELVMRFDYGSIVPWVQRMPPGIAAIGGPDSLTPRPDVPLRGDKLHTVRLRRPRRRNARDRDIRFRRSGTL